MKKVHSCLLVLAAFTVSFQAVPAQGTDTLEIDTYAGLTITVTEDGFRDIQVATDLSKDEPWTLLEPAVSVKAGMPTLWFDPSSPVVGKRFYRVVQSPVRPVANMVAISSGTFLMGSPSTEADRSTKEGPQTIVTLTKGFYMGKHEVTQAEYLDIMDINPSSFTGDMSRPADSVSWENAVAYCATLTARERAAGRCPAEWEYRLPTEAEWEYACRAGTTTRFSYGDDDALLGNYGWYSANSNSMTHPVGRKAPNLWGLYDMLGNVSEWCQDSWDGSSGYPGGSTIDPLGTEGSSRVQRGGVWLGSAAYARCARRGYGSLGYSGAGSLIGFRVVLGPRD